MCNMILICYLFQSDDSASSLRKRRSNIETSPHRRRLSVIIPPPKKKQHRSLFYKVTRYVENKKQQIFYMFLFYAFTAIVVFERVFSKRKDKNDC